MSEWRKKMSCSLGFHQYGEWLAVAKFMGTEKDLYVRSCECCNSEQYKSTQLKKKCDVVNDRVK